MLTRVQAFVFRNHAAHSLHVCRYHPFPVYIWHYPVLPLNMVDNSSSPLQTNFGLVFRGEAVQRSLLFLEPGSI
jgi:hypothetical protein